ncbi:MAG: acetyl-CoA hydrolase/transferase family protein [Methanoregulaceae archaeon]|jgi:acyl-CoA hydrolase|nr:acetyl-CoA hydrolase/transferase family protein [Methanoregulaceae archaeon]
MRLAASALEAVSGIGSGDRVYVHGMAAAPQALVKALAERKDQLRDVEIVQLHTEGVAPYATPDMAGHFRVNALFMGANIRGAVNDGRADFIPVFLSEVPKMFLQGILPLDAVLIQVSPPDRHGFCSLGVSIEATRAATLSAKRVIAQINRHMPRTHGDGVIHVNSLTAVCEHHEPLPEHLPGAPGEVESKIGRFCAELIEDGSTLQMGIGGIPDAVLAALKNHKDLGVHSEMFSDGVIELVEKGIINGSKKRVHPGKLVASFVLGSRRLFDFVDDNPQVAMLDVAYINDAAVIRRNPKVVAINSAIEVDITGQVCADSIGTKMYSGVGGQMDFIRGASLSEGGKPMIALPSVTSRGESRIVPEIKPGGGVVTTRANVHYIITEYGVAYLYGKNLRQRARALINIAHPDHRETLERYAAERFGSHD